MLVLVIETPLKLSVNVLVLIAVPNRERMARELKLNDSISLLAETERSKLF